MKILLAIVDPDYQGDISIDELIKSNQNEILKRTLKLAEINGLRYYFIQKLTEMNIDLSFIKKEDLIDEMQQRSNDFKKTITFVNRISKEHRLEYVLIKVFNTIPHTPNDIDIFIHKKDRQKLITILEDDGMVCLQSSPAETKLKGRFLNIDIYTEICYVGVDFIDERFLRKSVVKNNLLGIEYYGLNKEADFLLLLPHALFGHRRITLLDFLHLKNLKKGINIKECRGYAYEKGWGTVFDLILNQLDSLCHDIYVKNNIVKFPYYFNRNFVLRCVYKLDNFDKNKFNLFFFNLSFYLEEIMYRLEGTALYNILKFFTPTRNIFNSICSFVKNRRGDTKSIDEEEERGA
jgi:hypothetical protein